VEVERLKAKSKAKRRGKAPVEGDCAPCAEKSVASAGTQEHQDHDAHKRRLSRLVGQLQGIGRMLDEGRYCPDIMVQTRAAMAAIKALEDSILEGHMQNCVTAAFHLRDQGDVKAKIDELMLLFRKRM
jgi:DNA-binding FrmR family transcriptional regulator